MDAHVVTCRSGWYRRRRSSGPGSYHVGEGLAESERGALHTVRDGPGKAKSQGRRVVLFQDVTTLLRHLVNVNIDVLKGTKSCLNKISIQEDS